MRALLGILALAACTPSPPPHAARLDLADARAWLARDRQAFFFDDEDLALTLRADGRYVIGIPKPLQPHCGLAYLGTGDGGTWSLTANAGLVFRSTRRAGHADPRFELYLVDEWLWLYPTNGSGRSLSDRVYERESS